MAKAAKTMAIIAGIAIAVFLYLHAGAHLGVSDLTVSVESATERQDTFDALRIAIMRGDMDNAWTQQVSEDASEYCFVTYSAKVANRGLLPAEWVLLNTEHREGDVVAVTGDPLDLPALSGGPVSCVLLTTKENAEETRLAWIDYYVWGRLFSATVEEAQ